MPQIKIKFSGELNGISWKAGEWFEAPQNLIDRLNPMAYRTRPLEAKHTRPMKAEKHSDKLEVMQAGSWWQVWKGEEKLKSFRNEEDARNYAG